MNITFQGNPVTIKHEAVKPKEKLKPFTAIRNDMSEWRSEDSTGTRIFLSVPSLDTGVCSMEVAKFINYAKELKDVTIYAISMDLPFALERWCQAKNNENVITLSDYKLDVYKRQNPDSWCVPVGHLHTRWRLFHHAEQSPHRKFFCGRCFAVLLFPRYPDSS